MTMKPDGALQTFIDDLARVVATTGDEYEITERVAERLSAVRPTGAVQTFVSGWDAPAVDVGQIRHR
jgi:hypothetical protein